jgi:redox-sensitive bicupin YhaK (pirin superfamily)
MTARSRITNEDTPKGDGEGRMGSVQLWPSLPGSHNLTDPRQENKSRLDIVIATATWLSATRS